MDCHTVKSCLLRQVVRHARVWHGSAAVREHSSAHASDTAQSMDEVVVGAARQEPCQCTCVSDRCCPADTLLASCLARMSGTRTLALGNGLVGGVKEHRVAFPSPWATSRSAPCMNLGFTRRLGDVSVNVRVNNAGLANMN